MATAIIVSPPPVERDPVFVQLTLSEDEAVTLGMVLMRVGGDPSKSRRRYAQSVLTAIEELSLADLYGGLFQEDPSASLFFTA